MGMIRIKHKIVVFGALFAALLLFASLNPLAAVIAQEDERLDENRGVSVIAGPHNVRVVIINSNLSAGFLQMALFITDASNGDTVSDAQVILKANNDDQDYEGWGTAHNSPADPRRYDARMNLGSTGDWVINVDVSSSLGQGGAEALNIQVPALKRYTSGSLVFFAIFGVMMLGIAYLFWSVKRENRRRAAVLLADASVNSDAVLERTEGRQQS
jgi:cbb3-type cytochrome oxidase subunit 3